MKTETLMTPGLTSCQRPVMVSKWMGSLMCALLLGACGDDTAADGSDGDGDGGDCAQFGDGNTVPSVGATLVEYLKCGAYTGLSAESAQHDSSGPHLSQVRVFVNSALEGSLSAGNTEHPEGSAAIKELYRSSSTERDGWAVAVKTGASDGGQGWYWFEQTSVDGSPVAEGQGVSLCTGCHSAGSDFFLTTFPLQ